MKVLHHHGGSVNARHISEAVEALKNGYIIIYPTDTLYAFGCDVTDNRAVERLCALKELNPEKNLLSIVCGSLSQASAYTRIDNKAFGILKQYLPGPYTFILPMGQKLPKAFKGRRQAGVRIPDNDIAMALADELGNPLMSASVNPIEEEMENYSADGELIAERYGYHPEIALAIVDGPSGTEPSTVVDLTDSDNPTLIRPGIGEWPE